jgi:hypothetical protein
MMDSHERECGVIDDPSQTDNIRKIVEKTIDEARTRRCPACKAPYIKISGCNHITCSKCKTHSCYICSKTLTPKNIPGTTTSSVYYHFKDLSTSTSISVCPLYNNGEHGEDAIEQKFADERVTEKCIQLIDRNIREVAIVMLEIAKRLDVHFTAKYEKQYKKKINYMRWLKRFFTCGGRRIRPFLQKV